MSTATDRASTEAAWAFCHAVLPEVSRTFALNIPVLPRGLRDAVCCAYLLCRIADTIEDGVELDEAERGRLYAALERAVDADAPGGSCEPFARAAPSHAGYARLMRGVDQVLAAYATLPEAARAAIADCVREMIDGMRRSGSGGEDAPADGAGGVRFVCEDFDGLDRYCHYVAGTVGVMLTRLFAHERSDATGLACAEGRELGRRFGLGLQATNIIKDHAEDVARGVCFAPRDCVDASVAGCLVRPERRGALIGHALGHLDAAMAYVLRIPADAEGMRLFCVWALMLALGTLREAARGSAATPKVGRDEVVTILSTSRRRVGDDAALRAWFDEYRRAVRAAPAAVRARRGAAGGADPERNRSR